MKMRVPFPLQKNIEESYREYGIIPSFTRQDFIRIIKLKDGAFNKWVSDIYYPQIERQKSAAENKILDALDSAEAYAEQMRKAKVFTYREKHSNPNRPLREIAGEAVERYFPQVPKESNNKTKYGVPVLNRKWVKLRDSIRSATVQKRKAKE